MTARLAIVGLLLFSAPLAAQPSAEDLVIVDCRLPPKQRRIGGRTYTIAGKPVRTTVVDCNIRGGEYTVYDRANYATSLKVWLAEAEKGSADAQYYVARLYEGGLGTQPDYRAAAQWYEKAAKAGHSASQFSLGRLYEKGLGVTADSTKAFALYRQASGLGGNYVIVDSAQYAALEQAAQELALREQEIEELQQQIRQDEKRRRELQQQLDELKGKAEAQKNEVARLQKQLKAPPPSSVVLQAPARSKLGRYFALVIGNSRYEQLAPVPTAENDAKAMAALLRNQYGFDVTLLLNANSTQILSSLFKLSQSLAENDNLVVFYAGHGKRDLRNRRGWWLPVDAAKDTAAKTNWLPNQDVSDRLALIPARHILVLADASYVGDLTRGAPQPEPQSMMPAEWAKYVENTQRRRARLALASGAETAQGRFTTTLINVLQKQKGVFPASRVHREVVNLLTSDGSVSSAVPTFAPLPAAFHDGVDFLFERK
ncbi:MAG TPA: caspase family protein [Thermoanaerobaculia bacterium]